MRELIQLSLITRFGDKFNVGLFIYISLSVYYMIKQREKCSFTMYRGIFYLFFKKWNCLIFLNHKNAKPTNIKIAFIELYFCILLSSENVWFTDIVELHS